MSFGGPDYLPSQMPLKGKVAKNSVLWLPRDGDPSVLDPVDIFNPLPVQPIGPDGGPATVQLVNSGGTSLTPTTGFLVDTELPTAAALGDSDANPTTPLIGAALMGWNTSVWRRLVSLNGVVSSPSVSSVLATAQIAYNSVSGAPEALRPNLDGTLLASAARVATTSTSDQTNFNHRGVRVFWNITVVPTIETITPTIEVKDPVSGVYTAILTGAARATSGHVLLEVYPGVGTTANLIASDILSRTWRVTFTHSASGSWTYSAGYSLIL